MRAVAAPTDRRFRRAQPKSARKRKVNLRQAWLSARIVGVLTLAVYGGWRGTALVLGASYLQVSRISVRGNDRLSNGEVLALVHGLRGRNILTVSLAEWQTRLLSSPWVEDARLRRVLPSRIDIAIRERVPMGIARLSGALYLVDDEGVVIDEFGPNYADLNLPMIDGLASRQSDGAADQARARLAARVLTALEARPDLAERVSQIDVADAHDAVVMLDGDTAMLRLGEDEFVERIQGYLDVAPALRERVADIDYVDMRFNERLYVRPVKKGGATAPPQRR